MFVSLYICIVVLTIKKCVLIMNLHGMYQIIKRTLLKTCISFNQTCE